MKKTRRLPRGERENNRPSGTARQKKLNKALRVAVIAAAVLVAILGLAALAYAILSTPPDVTDSSLKDQTTPPPAQTAVPDLTPEATAAPDATPEPTPEASFRREDTYTLLVVGRDKVRLNTDTIMVARFDCGAGTLDVVSIPRDTLVNVPWAVKKVNSVYGSLGAQGLVDEAENLVGFEIDNYVIVSTAVFRGIIDCVGGIWYDVPMYMDYDDPMQDLHIHLGPGYQLLDGHRSEQLVRFRQNNNGTGYPNGDLGRIEAQHSFFREAARQVLSLGNLPQLPEMVRIVLDNTDTDLTAGNIAFYAQEFLKLDAENIRFHTLPFDEVYIRGGSYVSIRLAEWVDMINTCLNPFSVDVTEENLDVLTCSDSGFYSTTGSIPELWSFYDYLSLAG